MSAARILVPQRAVRLMTARFVLTQTGLAVVVLGLFALWLQVPDASALDVIGSVLLGLLLICVAGAGETWLVLRLGRQPLSLRRNLLGMGLWVVAALLWWAWFAWIHHLGNNTVLYASYLNSKLPPGVRVLASFSRLEAVMDWLGTMLAWGAGALLAIPVVALLLSAAPARATGRVVLSLWWWLLLIVAANLGAYGTAALLHWVPGHALGPELLGLLFRLVLSLVLDGLLVSALLCVLVETLECAGPAQSAPGGTPVISQPRTADAP